MVKEASSLAKEGFILGLKTGLGFSIVYLLLFVLATLLPFEPINSLSEVGEQLIAFLVIFVVALVLYGGIVGIVLATLLGAVTGWITGLVFARRSMGSGREAIQTGMTICTAIVLPLNLAALPLFWSVFDRTWGGAVYFYTLYFGVPSLVYIIASIWASARLYYDTTKAGASLNRQQLAEES